MSSGKKHIAVLGAGVIGLQTALTLLESGYSVTVAAKHWPDDEGIESIEYTSTKAGAHWRTHCDAEDRFGRECDAATFKHWESMVASGEGEKAGIVPMPAISLWDSETPETVDSGAGLWWSSLVPDFSILRRGDPRLPGDAHFGVAYGSFCVNPNKYLPYLLSRVRARGGETVVAEVGALGEVFGIVPRAVGVVNCTGMGAMKLVAQPEAEKVYPTRGQTILVRGEAKSVRFRTGDGYLCYVVRRLGQGTILGGCKQDGNWDEKVDPELAQEIQRRCKPLAPELLVGGEFDIISEQVGRRPSRVGGPRIEIERVPEDGVRRFICHHYGHSGAGFQSSVGTTNKAVELIKEELGD